MTRNRLLGAMVLLAILIPAMQQGWIGQALAGILGAGVLCMSASNALEDSMAKHIFQNANIANIGDATGLRGSTTAGSLYVALHTADPGEAGDQTTSEATYTGYARVGVARDSSNWTVSGTAPTQAANTNTVTFGLCTAGSNTISHFSIGLVSSGASVIVISGALGANLAVSAGITPSFAAGTLTGTVD